jgi:protein-tyrosine phosphatase
MPEYPIRWITEQLAVGYAPRSHADLDVIRAQGIIAIVNLCAECYDLHELEKQTGFEVYYLPLPDESAPDIETLEKILAWIAERIAGGKKILIHCRFGIGRTGTVVLAYLFKKGFDLRQALNSMKHTPAMPMSYDQWKLLRKFSDQLGLPKTPLIETQSAMDPESKTYFRKWKAMQKWFEAEEWNNGHQASIEFKND